MNLGSAFQIVDDTLDYVAKEEEFGKAIGKDFDEGKITLPLIRTLELCSEDERKSVAKILENPKRDGNDTAKIMNMIHRYDGIRYAEDKAGAFIADSKAILSGFPDSPGRSALSAIADFVIERTS